MQTDIPLELILNKLSEGYLLLDKNILPLNCNNRFIECFYSEKKEMDKIEDTVNCILHLNILSASKIKTLYDIAINCIKSGEVLSDEFSFETEGKERFIRYSFDFIDISNDSVIEKDRVLLLRVQDITAYRKIINDMAERYRIMKKESYAKDMFVDILSHEFRTPILGILGGIELINAEYCDANIDKCLFERLNSIQCSAKRLNLLVNDMTDISRICTKGMPVFPRKNFVINVFREAVEDIEHMIKWKGHKLSIEVDSELTWCFDTKLIIRAVSNLLSNAAKYTFQNGEICLMASVEDNILHISVNDNGCGIPEDEIDNIFNKFYIVDRDIYSSVSDRLGVGLFIVKNIIEKHEGIIEVDSKEGKGSTFHIYLPHAEPQC